MSSVAGNMFGCVVVLAPHMDDDVIGMGGTIAYLSERGNEVYVVYLTDGGANYSGVERKRYVETRKDEARRTSQILSVRDVYFLDYPDAKLHQYVEPATEKVIDIVLHRKAGIIYVPHANEYHIDHRAANEIAKIVAWKLAFLYGHTIHYIYEYEVWPPMNVFTDVINITNYIEIKRKALQILANGSQKYIDPEAILALNRYRAFWTIGGGYVEAFNAINIWGIRTLKRT